MGNFVFIYSVLFIYFLFFSKLMTDFQDDIESQIVRVFFLNRFKISLFFFQLILLSLFYVLSSFFLGGGVIFIIKRTQKVKTVSGEHQVSVVLIVLLGLDLVQVNFFFGGLIEFFFVNVN